MRTVTKFFGLGLAPALYVTACALLAAALAYPLHLCLGDASDFRTLVSRGGLVLLVLGLFPLARRLGLDRNSLGLAQGMLPLRQIGIGLVPGSAMLGLHVLALLALDVRTADPDAWADPYHLGKAMLQALGIGLIVAGIEETVFRGVLFALIRKGGGIMAAAWISAFYYSLVHFLRSKWQPGTDPIDWSSGFRILAEAYSHLLALPPDSFLALWIAGLFLAWVRSAFSLGLGYCIGIHAGWVFVIKTTKVLTDSVPAGAWSHLVGHYDGIIGYLAAAWMGLLTLMLFFAWRRQGYHHRFYGNRTTNMHGHGNHW